MEKLFQRTFKQENKKEKYKKYQDEIKRRERSGFVFKGCNIENVLILDLKEIPFLGILGRDRPSYVDTEISLLQEVQQHRNIIKLLDVETRPKSVYMILERMDWTMKSLIDDFPGVVKHKGTLKKCLCDILNALAYCHSLNIIHQDVKPQNIVFTGLIIQDMKLTDFGSARKLEVPATTTTYTPGERAPSLDESTWYMAPELLMHQPNCSAPVDIWSLGCVFAEMVTSQPLFGQRRGVDQLTRIFSIMGTPTEEHWPEVSSWMRDSYGNLEPKTLAYEVPGLDPDGLDLLSRMLSMNPSTRITATDALEHPYLIPPPESFSSTEMRKPTLGDCFSSTESDTASARTI